tara:strand:+ start:703 stop:864 length:162 start_codon:yes stop_codon:yes gene_type:complete
LRKREPVNIENYNPTLEVEKAKPSVKEDPKPFILTKSEKKDATEDSDTEDADE